jgi:hypothetical protein
MYGKVYSQVVGGSHRSRAKHEHNRLDRSKEADDSYAFSFVRPPHELDNLEPTLASDQ